MDKFDQKKSQPASNDTRDVACFFFDDILVATEATPSTIRSYLRNAVKIRPQSGDRPGTRGRNALFTKRRLFQIAIMHKLVGIGLQPATASAAAYSFTDEASETLDGELTFENPNTTNRRKPGQLYPGQNVRTMLWILSVENGHPETRLLKLLDGHPVGGDVLLAGTAGKGLFLDITQVALEIGSRLGIDFSGSPA